MASQQLLQTGLTRELIQFDAEQKYQAIKSESHC